MNGATGSAERLVECSFDGCMGGRAPEKPQPSRPGRDKFRGEQQLFCVVGKNFVLVDIESFLLFTAHQVDVELGYTDFAEAVELFTVVVDGTDHAETVDDFVGDEFGVVAADFAVVEIVVLATVFYERGQRGGQLFGLVFGDEVHHVIGNQRGKPADVFAGGFQVVGSPDGGGGHDFDFAEVAAGFLGAFADEAQAPVDQVGIGELEDDAVADASGGAEGFGAVAGDPDAGNFAIGPGKLCGHAIEIDRFAGVQVAEDADEFLEVFECGGFFPQHAAGAVAAPDAQFHAPLRGQIEGGEQAGGNGDIAHRRVCDASTQAHFFRIGGHERQERKRFLPDHVGIEDPAEGESGDFGLACKIQNPADGDIRFDGDAEVHGK